MFRIITSNVSTTAKRTRRSTTVNNVKTANRCVRLLPSHYWNSVSRTTATLVSSRLATPKAGETKLKNDTKTNLQQGSVVPSVTRTVGAWLHTFNTPDENIPTTISKYQVDGSPPPFTKLLAANRGEISCRINRAASELGILTAGIYSYEGKN